MTVGSRLLNGVARPPFSYRTISLAISVVLSFDLEYMFPKGTVNVYSIATGMALHGHKCCTTHEERIRVQLTPFSLSIW